MKKIAILQSNYIPWKGYFDLINMVDEFIIYDDVQFTKNNWRNRNKIKIATGLQWLTIPVTQSSLSQKINETKTSNELWRKKHWKSIVTNYSKAPHFKDYREVFESLYLDDEELYLSLINYKFIMTINQILGIKTKISWSGEYELTGGQTERIVNLCKQAKATEYISGPAAKNYIDEAIFSEENVKLTWIDYSGYPEYNQLFGEFAHNVSIVDLIFNEGPDSTKYMKSF